MKGLWLLGGGGGNRVLRKFCSNILIDEIFYDIKKPP